MAEGKKIKAARAEVLSKQSYTLEEALESVVKVKYAKFDETVELAIRLGVDPKHADQQVRGTVVLPHGIGKTKKVLVVASGEKQKEAEQAGADMVAGEEIIEKIQGGWMDFEAMVATPDMMKSVGKLGKILGPRGLMPNPKTGTVTFEVAKAVQEIKAGKVEYRLDKTAVIHVPIGKVSFGAAKLVDNARVLLEAIAKAKPATAKGKYMKSLGLSSTMGPGIRVNLQTLEFAK